MAVVVARMVANLEAETSGFQSRMTAAETQLNRWSSSTVTGTRATRLLERGMQELSFQVAGIPGPIGKVGTAIGALGIGGGPIMIAVAALGALALIWKEVDAAATLAADNVVAAAKRMRDSISSAVSNLGPDVGTAIFHTRIAQAQAQLDSLRRAPLGPDVQRFIPPMGPGDKGSWSPIAGSAAAQRAADIGILTDKINQLTVGLNKLGHTAENEAAKGLRTLGEQLDQITADIKSFIAHTPFFDQILQGIKIPTLAQLQGAEAARQVELAVARQAANAISVRLIGVGQGRADPGTRQAPTASREALQIAQMAAGSVMMMMSGGSGAMTGMGTMMTGLSGMKAVGAAAGPLGWLGLGFSLLGDIFSHKADQKELADERRHRELIGAIHEGPARVTNVFEGDPATSLYEQRRQERLGGQPRNGGL